MVCCLRLQEPRDRATAPPADCMPGSCSPQAPDLGLRLLAISSMKADDPGRLHRSPKAMLCAAASCRSLQSLQLCCCPQLSCASIRPCCSGDHLATCQLCWRDPLRCPELPFPAAQALVLSCVLPFAQACALTALSAACKHHMLSACSVKPPAAARNVPGAEGSAHSWSAASQHNPVATRLFAS